MQLRCCNDHTVHRIGKGIDWKVAGVDRSFQTERKDLDFFGRLKGIIEIVGDPDDLIKPVFPLEDYDMLK